MGRNNGLGIDAYRQARAVVLETELGYVRVV